MSDCMMGSSITMMAGMGLVGLLILVVLILTLAALVKYLFFGGRSNGAGQR